MNQDQMFAEIIARKQARTQTTNVPGQPEHVVVVEQGSDPLPRSEPANDVSFRGSNNDKPVAKLHGPEVTQLEQPDPTPKADEVVTIGNLSIAVNKLTGWEAQFTRGGFASHFVTQDGVRVHENRALAVVFEAIRELQAGSK